MAIDIRVAAWGLVLSLGCQPVYVGLADHGPRRMVRAGEDPPGPLMPVEFPALGVTWTQPDNWVLTRLRYESERYGAVEEIEARGPRDPEPGRGVAAAVLSIFLAPEGREGFADLDAFAQVRMLAYLERLDRPPVTAVESPSGQALRFTIQGTQLGRRPDGQAVEVPNRVTTTVWRQAGHYYDFSLHCTASEHERLLVIYDAMFAGMAAGTRSTGGR